MRRPTLISSTKCAKRRNHCSRYRMHSFRILPHFSVHYVACDALLVSVSLQRRIQLHRYRCPRVCAEIIHVKWTISLFLRFVRLMIRYVDIRLSAERTTWTILSRPLFGTWPNIFLWRFVRPSISSWSPSCTNCMRVALWRLSRLSSRHSKQVRHDCFDRLRMMSESSCSFARTYTR